MKKIISLLLIVVMTVNGLNDCFAIGPDDVENPDSYGATTEITDGIEPDDHKETFWDKAKRNIKCVGGLAVFAGLIIGGGYIVGSLRANGYNRDDDLELPQEQNNINTLEDYKPTIVPVDKIEHPELFMDKIPEQNSVEPIIEPEDDIAYSIEEKKENTQQRRQLATVRGTCGSSLTWTLDTDNGKLTISGSGSMYIYASDSKAPWYLDRESITSVTIKNGVTSIGQMAFFCCSGLTSIDIPSSVTSIRSHAFDGCSGLTSIDIPSSVTSIGYDAFYGCSGLTSVTYRGVTEPTHGADVFAGCNALKVVKVPLAYNGSYFCEKPVQKPPRTKSRDDILPKNSRTRVFLGFQL